MDDLLQLMHDTMNALVRIRSCVYMVRKSDVTEEDKKKYCQIIEESEEEVRNKLDEYYKKVRNGV